MVAPQTHATNASKQELGDVDPTARWRGTLVSTEMYNAMTPVMNRTPLSHLHGHAFELDSEDVLHLFFADGFAGDLVASSIVVMCRAGFYGECGGTMASLKSKLDACHQAACKWLKESKRHVVGPPFTLASLGTETHDSMPAMSG